MTRLLVLVAALASLGMSSCSSAPLITECLVTIGYNEFRSSVAQCLTAYSNPADQSACVYSAYERYHVADCIDHNKKESALSVWQLDGMYAYTPKDRSKILRWAERNCGRRGD